MNGGHIDARTRSRTPRWSQACLRSGDAERNKSEHLTARCAKPRGETHLDRLSMLAIKINKNGHRG